MLRNFCDSPIHKWCALSLAFIFSFVIFLTIPAAADDVTPSPAPSPIRPNDPVGWKDGDTFRDIMLVVLDGWGISFSKSDSDDSTPLLDYADDLLEEFYAEQNTTSDVFWDMVKYGASETGDLILDFLGVNKIRQFANWLQNKFSLSNNSSVNVQVSFPVLPLWDGNSANMMKAFRYDGQNMALAAFSNPTYYFAVQTDNYYTAYAVAFFSNRPDSSQQLVRTYNMTYGGFSTENTDGYVFETSWGYGNIYNIIPPRYVITELYGYWPIYSSLETALNEFNHYVSGSSSGLNITINTTTINIPSEDMDPEDGLRIEVPGTNWGDSIYTILNIIERLIGLYDSTQLNINTVIDLISTLLQGLQKSVAVENIPGAVVLDYDEYDIPLETEWSLVDGFFSEETEGSPFSTLTTILYGLPEPFILFFSVIVVFVVAYGFIRLGRDSH